MMCIKGSKKLDVIVPVTMEGMDITAASLRERLLELHRVYRFDTFALAFPRKGWRCSQDCPTREYFLAQSALFRDVQSSLDGEDIRLGWWNTLTIKASAVPGWQRLVMADGREHGFGSCPLDGGYRAWLADSMALVASEACPAFIMVEDDFGLHGGCFCQRHLDEFSRREGRVWTREALVEAMNGESDGARELFSRWSDLRRDTLADFARDIRRAVDCVAPEMPIGTCQSGSWNQDGDATEAVTRGFAGRTQPFTRLYGVFYSGEDISSIPEELHQCQHYKETLPEDVICLHESDTYPHNSFFTSASCMRAMMSIVYSQGFDGSVFQGGYLHKDRAYASMYAAEADRFQALHDAAKQCTVGGVRLPYRAGFRKGNGWLRSIAHFGIPYTTREAAVTCLSGGLAEAMSDEELTALFARGLFLDGDAASVLAARGYGELMGVDVLPNPIVGMEKYDLEITERVQGAAVPRMADCAITSHGAYAPGGDGTFHGLSPHEGTEVVTRAYTWEKVELCVAMTRHVNRLGGRVVVMGLGTQGNRSLALFNIQRQALIQELLCWSGAEAAWLKGAFRVSVVMNESQSPDESGFLGMLSFVSLNPDSLSGLSVHLPGGWRRFGSLLRLDDSGEWREQAFERTDDGVDIPVTLGHCRNQAFLFCL